MTYLAECFAWCMLQVTLFTAATAIAYWLAGRRSNGNVQLLAVAFGTIAALTAVCMSPWPRWNFPATAWDVTPNTFAALDLEAPTSPDLASLTGSATEAQPDNLPKGDILVLHRVDVPPTQLLANESGDHAWQSLWRTAVWIAWIAAAIGALRFAAGFAYVIRYRRASQPIDDKTTQQDFESLRSRLGAPANVELHESPALNVAATIGWRRPMILLPSEWHDWNADERRAVLAHELAHVAQRHFPVWIASQLATVAHFYHPLVHWLGRRLRLEQELAADELAADAFGCRRRYAAVLASLAIGTPQPAAIVGLGLFMSRPLLMRRITMLRDTTEHRRPSRLVRASSVLLLTTSAIAIAGLRATTTAASGADESPGDGSTTIIEVDPTRQNFLAEEVEVEEVSNEAESKPMSPGITIRSDSSGTLQLISSPQIEDGATTNPRYVTSLIQVARHPWKLPSSAGGQLDSDAEWQVYRQTQLAVLRSLKQLQSALDDPAVAKLDLIKSQADPLRWLSDNLDAGFIDASEIMYVRLNSSLGNREELAAIVDAVVAAYMNDVVSAERQRQMVVRDALAKSYQQLSDEIQRKMEEQHALSADLGVSDGTSPDARSQLLLTETAELIRNKVELERQLADVESAYQIAQTQGGDGENSLSMRREYQIRAQLFHRQIASLNEAIKDKSEAFIRRGEGSVELQVRQTELKQLQEVAREMSIELEKMDVASLLPDRVRVIQPAM